jgi:hypothetical protein
MARQNAKHPLAESFRRENLPSLAASALVPMLAGATYYLTFVWYVKIFILYCHHLTFMTFQDGCLYGNNT